MCGRYAMPIEPTILQQRLNELNVPVDELSNTSKFIESYNISPTNNAPIYYKEKSNQKSHLDYLSWGLIPYWTKFKSDMNQYKTFNARKESVLQGNRLWKTVRNSTRCVIPVVGYYEWKHEKLGQGKKVNKKPYFIKKKDGELMFLAGLFSSVKFENDEEMHTFTIITGPAPKYMEWLHFRMPIILEPGTSAWDQWLSNEDYTDKIGQESLKEYGKEGFEWFEVSKDVGKTTNDGEYLIKPLLKGNIGDFFGKNEKNQMNKKIDEKVVKEEAKQENQLIGEDSHKGSDEEKHGLTEEKLKNQEETPVQKKEALKKENSETNERKRPKNISILDRLRSHTTKKQKT